MEDVEIFYNRIKELCKLKKITQRQLCEDLNFYLQNYKNKKTKNHYLSLLETISIAKYFNVSVEYLVYGIENNNNDINTLEKLKVIKLNEKLERIKKIINE